MYDFKVDYVVPWVDPSDPNWIKLYNKYKDEEFYKFNHSKRYDINPIFKYAFRGIEKFMPWINNVYLLVQSESQIPKWIDRSTVRVITHDQFIPSEYLPTFNSEVIEDFLWNIPGLEEHFIYGNDDIFVTRECSISDFFTKDGSPKSTRKPPPYRGGYPYNVEIKNITDLVNSYFNVNYEFTYTEHGLNSFVKSEYKRVFDIYKDKIEFARFRTPRTVQQYLWVYHEQVKTQFKNLVTGLTLHKFKFDKDIQFKKLLCLSNIDFTKDEDRLWDWKLYKLLYSRSKYELSTKFDELDKLLHRRNDKYIHLVYLTDINPVPSYLNKVVSAYKDKNPNWTVVAWVGNSKDIIEYLDIKLFKDLYNDQSKVNPIISKLSDVIKLAILYKYGGIYVDCDTYPIKSFDSNFTSIGFNQGWYNLSWKYLDAYFMKCIGYSSRMLLYKAMESQLGNFDKNECHEGLFGIRPNFQKIDERVGWMKTNKKKSVTDLHKKSFLEGKPIIVDRCYYINHYFLTNRDKLN